MVEFVGVKNSFDFSMGSEDARDILKREALLLDRIAIHDFDPADGLTGLSPEVNAEIRWLYEQDVIFKPRIPLQTDDPTLSEEFKDYTDGANELFDLLKELNTTHPPEGRTRQQTQYLFEISMLVTQLDTRAACLYLRDHENMDACWSFSHFCNPPFLSSLLPSFQPKKVLDIVLTKLPIPNETTSWEQILEFRSDPDSRSKFLALRNWMNEMARGELTPVEIEQKLEFLMDDYSRHMQLYKMKANKGILQTVVVSPAELVEDIVKLRFGKVAKNLFALRERKIALLEGELKSPGREVAYIIKAKETFES